jgi:uncharacterized protein YodC (DUF2158 family)
MKIRILLMSEFRLGDRVMLNSGGPELTISQIDEIKNEYTCRWFSGNNLKEKKFNGATITSVSTNEAEIIESFARSVEDFNKSES